MNDLFENEYQQYQLICGVDEVGRGPLIGDVVTAAVILDPNKPIEGLNDSKKLSEKKRLALFDEIKLKAKSWAIARCSAQEIDDINILQASLLAMKRAVDALDIKPEFALIDGNKIPQGLICPADAIVKGDGKYACIGAASILAKVTRDQEMIELGSEHPEYGFEKHKGYPTKQHFKAIEEHGVLDSHRKSFAPVARHLEKAGV